MTKSSGILAWLRSLGRREPDGNLNDELRFHLEMESAALVRGGMAVDAARDEARRRFGGVDRYVEELRDVRGGRLAESLGQDAHFALRMARRFPGFTTIVVATLAFAIGANTAFFSVVEAVILRPLPFAHPEQVVAVYAQNPDKSQPRFSVSYADYLDWRRETHTFSDMAVFASTSITLIGDTGPERLSGLAVSSNLFDILGVRAARGRLFGPEDARGESSDAVVLTDPFWRRQYGADSAIIGKRIQLSGRVRTVIGVLPATFQLGGQPVDAVTVFSPSSIPGVENHGQHMLQSVARLKPGVSLEQAQHDLNAVAARLADSYPMIKGWSANVFRVTDEQTRGIKTPLLVLFAAAGLVLLIGCINVANLLITRAAARGQEVALRQALGASRARLVSQLLVESAILSGAGGLLGVAVGWAGTRALVAAAPAGVIPRLDEVSLDGRVLVFALVLSVLTAFIVGLWPAFRATTPRLAGMLRDGGRTSAGSTNAPRLRRVLVVAEVSLAMVLLTCSGLVIQSLRHMMGVQPGFAVDHVVTMRLTPGAGYNDTTIVLLYRDLAARLEGRAGIESAAAANTAPLAGGGIITPIRPIGRPTTGAAPLMSAVTAVTPAYFRTTGIPLLRGRDVQWGESKPVLLVSELAAKTFWPGEEVIGKRIAFGLRDTLGLEIVGVVKDSHARGLTVDPIPMVYMSYDGATSVARSMTIVVRGAGDATSIITTTRSVLRDIDAKLPLYNIQTLRDIVDQSIAQPRLNTLLLGVFAAMAVLLAGIGVYGVVSYSVAQRTQEMGVRMALGASGRCLVGLVLREGAVLAAVGVVVGLVGAAGATRFIQSWLFGIERMDTMTLVATAAGIFGMTLLASLVPARRATRIDPLLAMRAE